MKRAFLFFATLFFLQHSYAQLTGAAATAYGEAEKFMSEQKFDQAATKLKKVTELSPMYSKAYKELGFCYNELGKFEESVKVLRKAIGLDPLFYEAFTEMGYAFLNLKTGDSAIYYYNKAIKIDPDNSIAFAGLGDVYQALLKDYDKAISIYQQAIKYDKEDFASYYWIGWCYSEKGESAKGLSYLKKAAEGDPLVYDYQTELGFAYYNTKDYRNAVSTLEKAIKLDPGKELAVYYLALSYEATSQYSLRNDMVKKLKSMKSKYAEEFK